MRFIQVVFSAFQLLSDSTCREKREKEEENGNESGRGIIRKKTKGEKTRMEMKGKENGKIIQDDYERIKKERKKTKKQGQVGK